ncbi:hypothetical protein ASD98_21240 [Flavobacterium sp. Root186]|nr:hypothetical protein ASD98_21240 [Flavobacterium sp. Root186]
MSIIDNQKIFRFFLDYSNSIKHFKNQYFTEYLASFESLKSIIYPMKYNCVLFLARYMKILKQRLTLNFRKDENN